MASLHSINELSLLSNANLKASVRAFEAEVRRLKVESMVFENFLVANEPSLVERLGVTMEKVQEMQQTQMINEPSKTVSQQSETRMSGTFDIQSFAPSIVDGMGYLRVSKGPRINLSQKTDLVMREMEDIQLKLQKFTRRTNLEKKKILAESEEATIRDGELKETMSDFEEVVVIEGLEKLTQKIPAEKFVRYMLEWLKYGQAVLEKLRLRTFSLRTQKKKLEILLAQKEDLGECVHEVDFEKLHIENKNFQLRVEQMNKHLMELKQMQGKANLMVAANKNFLQKQQVMLDEIKGQIKSTELEVEELIKSYDQTVVAIQKFQVKFENLKHLARKYKVPEVMEYIVKKAELSELKKTLKIWLRKSKIQKIAMGTYAKTMCQLTGSHKPKASWFESTISTPDNISAMGLNIVVEPHLDIPVIEEINSIDF